MSSLGVAEEDVLSLLSHEDEQQPSGGGGGGEEDEERNSTRRGRGLAQLCQSDDVYSHYFEHMNRGRLKVCVCVKIFTNKPLNFL